MEERQELYSLCAWKATAGHQALTEVMCIVLIGGRAARPMASPAPARSQLPTSLTLGPGVGVVLG